MLKPQDKNAPAPQSVRLANLSSEAYAQSLADKINANAEASEFITETLVAMENSKRGPIALLWNVLIPSFGDDFVKAGVPYPRSDKPVVLDGIELRADKFKAEKPGLNNSTRSVDAYILDYMAEDLTAVKKARAMIAHCNNAADPVKAGEAPEEIQNLSVEQRDAEKSKAEGRITNARRAMRQAVSVWFKAKEIRDNLSENVDVNFVLIETSAGDELTSSPKAIYIQDKKKPTNIQVMLANQFNQLDIAKALANGGTYQALKNTLKREREKNKNKGDGDNAPMVKTIDGFVANVYTASGFVGGDDPDPVKVADIVKRCSKDKEFLLAFGDYAKVIGDIFGEVQSDYLTANRTRDAATRHKTAETEAGAEAA